LRGSFITPSFVTQTFGMGRSHVSRQIQNRERQRPGPLNATQPHCQWAHRGSRKYLWTDADLNGAIAYVEYEIESPYVSFVAFNEPGRWRSRFCIRRATTYMHSTNPVADAPGSVFVVPPRRMIPSKSLTLRVSAIESYGSGRAPPQ
jgi:hypothetical protein